MLAAVAIWPASQRAYGAYPLQWEATTTLHGGTNALAPYFMSSNSNGTLTQASGAYERGRIWKSMDSARRFDYGFGAEAWLGVASSADYQRYSAAAQAWELNACHPANIWLQQLYGEVKYRSLFMYAGMKENARSLFDSPLGVGDITLSRNARPIPQVRIGLTDFANVPFTRGWLQLQADVAYGKFADADWNEHHYNQYNYFVTTGVWMHYKRAYFRSNPDKPFSAMIGMQHAAQFGGVQTYYNKGVVGEQTKYKTDFGTFVDVFVQKKGHASGVAGDESYYNGNHLGSWDVKLSYRFHNGSMLTASLQSPWEDGSGIGKLNGWDGVWALEYSSADTLTWLKGAMVSYIDFTNQSGPMHWAPDDKPGTAVGGQATGADDYYNNYAYNGWQNYGMALGTPFVMSPIYNTDGYMRFAANRVRGFQIGISGHPHAAWQYRLMAAWRKSWGTPIVPFASPRESTSAMVEAVYSFPRINGLSAKASVAFDAGSLYRNHYGVAMSISYTGKLVL